MAQFAIRPNSPCGEVEKARHGTFLSTGAENTLAYRNYLQGRGDKGTTHKFQAITVFRLQTMPTCPVDISFPNPRPSSLFLRFCEPKRGPVPRRLPRREFAVVVYGAYPRPTARVLGRESSGTACRQSHRASKSPPSHRQPSTTASRSASVVFLRVDLGVNVSLGWPFGLLLRLQWIQRG